MGITEHIHRDATSLTLKCVECGVVFTIREGDDLYRMAAPCEHLAVRPNDGSSSAVPSAT